MGFSPNGVKIIISPENENRAPLADISNVPRKKQRIEAEIQPSEEKQALKKFAKSVCKIKFPCQI